MDNVWIMYKKSMFYPILNPVIYLSGYLCFYSKLIHEITWKINHGLQKRYLLAEA